METNEPGKILKHAIISLLLLGAFAILATGSIELYLTFGIDVEKTYNGEGNYAETEDHVYSGQKIHTSGNQKESWLFSVK